MPLAQYQPGSTDAVTAVTRSRIAALIQRHREEYLAGFASDSQVAASKEYDQMVGKITAVDLIPTGSMHLGKGAGLSFYLMATADHFNLPLSDAVIVENGKSVIERNWKQDNIADLVAAFHKPVVSLYNTPEQSTDTTGMTAFYIRCDATGPALTTDPIDDTALLYVKVSYLTDGKTLRKGRAVILTDDVVVDLTSGQSGRVLFPSRDPGELPEDLLHKAWKEQLHELLASPTLTEAVFQVAP